MKFKRSSPTVNPFQTNLHVRQFSRLVDICKNSSELFKRLLEDVNSTLSVRDLHYLFFKSFEAALTAAVPAVSAQLYKPGLAPLLDKTKLIHSPYAKIPAHLAVNFGDTSLSVTQSYPPAIPFFYNEVERAAGFKVEPVFNQPNINEWSRSSGYTSAPRILLKNKGFTVEPARYEASLHTYKILSADSILKQMTLSRLKQKTNQITNSITEKIFETEHLLKFKPTDECNLEGNKKTVQDKVELLKQVKSWCKKFDKQYDGIQLVTIENIDEEEKREEQIFDSSERVGGGSLQGGFYPGTRTLLWRPLKGYPKPRFLTVEFVEGLKNEGFDLIMEKNKFSQTLLNTQSICGDVVRQLMKKITNGSGRLAAIESSAQLRCLSTTSIQNINDTLDTLNDFDGVKKTDVSLIKLLALRTSTLIFEKSLTSSNINGEDLNLSDIDEKFIKNFMLSPDCIYDLRLFLMESIANFIVGNNLSKEKFITVSSENLLETYSSEVEPYIYIYDNLWEQFNKQLEKVSEDELIKVCLLKQFLRIAEIVLETKDVDEVLDVIAYYVINVSKADDKLDVKAFGKEFARSLGFNDKELDLLNTRLVDSTKLEWYLAEWGGVGI